MTNIIVHRRNTLDQLLASPTKYGVEVDIRSSGNRLIIHHDALVEGEDFEAWIKAYSHGTLILNVKEEGLEAPLIALMQQYRIADYFFLDQSFPFLVKWSKAGERRCAVRVSEYESIETALALAGKIDWVWVDCFTHLAMTKNDATRLEMAGFKLCLVSPELQGRAEDSDILSIQQQLNQNAIVIDAVCTKAPEKWESFFNS